MSAFHTEQIETPAGTYTVEFHGDDDAEQPYDDGFVLAVDGYERYCSDSRIDIEHGNAGDQVWNHREDSS